MPSDTNASARSPLLINFHDRHHRHGDGSSSSSSSSSSSRNRNVSTHSRLQARTRGYLSSRQNHYAVMGLVVLDVAGILADLFVSLVACDTKQRDARWVNNAQESLQVAGLVFSSLFLLELALSVWAFGLRYFSSWFHCFDGLVIMVSFVVDLLTHGIIEEIASLVIILRLWRFVKIVEELSVGASERMEEIKATVEQLRQQNALLEARLAEAA